MIKACPAEQISVAYCAPDILGEESASLRLQAKQQIRENLS